MKFPLIFVGSALMNSMYCSSIIDRLSERDQKEFVKDKESHKDKYLSLGTCLLHEGLWSAWADLDNPIGSGDYERAVNHCSKTKAAQARIVGTGEMITNENVSLTLTGFSCRNNDQKDKECKNYEVRFCCQSARKLQTGDCRCGQWSSWSNYASYNSEKPGDSELLVDRPDYYIGGICKRPEASQARVVSTGTIFTNQIVRFGLHGLVCMNENQVDGQCLDYEVRFCCANEGPTTYMALGHCSGQWSDWVNTDDPSGSGDFNILTRPCMYFGGYSTGVQGRIVQSLATSTHQVINLSLWGLWCINEENHGTCLDYEFRYCCEQPH